MGTDYEINASGNFAQQMEKNARAMEPVAKQFREIDKLAKDLERDAAKWITSVQTPQEKYNKQMERLKELYGACYLSQKQFHDATRKATDELHQKTGQSSTLLAGLSGLIKGQASSWLSVASAVGIATQALRDHDRVATESANKQMGSEEAVGRLAQIASGPALERLHGYVDVFNEATGNEDEAARSVLQLANVGAMQHAGTFAGLRASRAIGPVDTTLTAINEVQLASKQRMSPIEVAAMGMSGAATANKNFDEIMANAPKAVAAGQRVGMDTKSSMQLYIAAASVFGSSVGASSVESFYRDIKEKGTFSPGMSNDQLLAANSGILQSEAQRIGQVLTGQESHEKYVQARANMDAVASDPQGYLDTVASATANTGTKQGRFARVQQELRLQTARADNASKYRGIDEARQDAAIQRYQAKMGRGFFDNMLGWGADVLLNAEQTESFLGTPQQSNASVVNELKKQTAILEASTPKAPPLPSANP